MKGKKLQWCILRSIVNTRPSFSVYPVGWHACCDGPNVATEINLRPLFQGFDAVNFTAETAGADGALVRAAQKVIALPLGCSIPGTLEWSMAFC